VAYVGEFTDGPMQGEMFLVTPDPECAHAPRDRPAMYQEIRKPIVYRKGVPTGRVGVFRYRLARQTPVDGIWKYRFIDYSEACENAFQP
jgi:hypothetical protein